MRFCNAEEAVALIRDGATVIVDGSGGGVNEPGTILKALEARFLSTGSPRDLCVVHVSGMGSGHGDGIDRFAHIGMVKRVIGGHWGWTKGMQELAADNLIEAYCLPQGTISHLLRVAAAHGPGVISHIGLNTFVDPRIEGGRLNAAAVDDIVELVTLSGKEWIYTPVFPIDVAIIRGTTADENGNITMEGEGLLAETLAAAQAVQNNGGIVLAQVRNRVAAGSLIADQVRVPGILVDAIVVDPTQRLSNATDRDPALEGRTRLGNVAIKPMELGVRKVIARRAAAELQSGDIINLGFGMPDGVAAVLAEEGRASEVTFTVEQGHIGGVPAGGTDFGMARNAQASVTSDQQFDWYDGGGVDIAVLSFAEVDAHGNVNVGRFGRRAPGVGGFINISQGSHRVVFVGTFVAGGKYDVDGSGTIALPEGGKQKFVEQVQQISFSGERATAIGQPVLYVSERAVFELGPDGPVLIELAPGADLERDVIANMGFRPKVAANLKVMDPAFFTDAARALELTGTARAASALAAEGA
ncbi:acyl CoA:acetate/3-ketoacid CoA transferase [Rathayibacter soli]|uniref:acyl CoA:acetate/3-ketoacid CoA transferase n=1 Tax=Rathayibacter soli TaxID=3144168 RepID=UPI0027E560C1|nr:CoA-transferase [Glaciibacter superstes]